MQLESKGMNGMNFEKIQNINEIDEVLWQNLKLDFVSFDGIYSYAKINQELDNLFKPTYLKMEDDFITFVLMYRFKISFMNQPKNKWLRDFMEILIPRNIFAIIDKKKQNEDLIIFLIPNVAKDMNDKIIDNINDNIEKILNDSYKKSHICFISSHKVEHENFINEIQNSYMYFDIEPNWEKFEDFLQTLSAKKRYRILQDRKILADNNIIIEELLVDNCIDQIKKINELTKYPSPFDQLKKILYELKPISITGFFMGDILVEYLAMTNDDTYGYLFAFASDTKYEKEWNGMLNAYSYVVEYAIKNKLKRFYLGYTCEEAKALRGASKLSRYMNMKLI